MENPVKMDDLGGTTIFGNPHMESMCVCFSKKACNPQKIQMTLAVYKKLNYEGWLPSPKLT